MTFEELLEELKKKDLKVREKYKGVINSRLDGSPQAAELEKNKQWFINEWKKIQGVKE